MRIEFTRPQLATRRGIEGVDICAGVAEIDRIPVPLILSVSKDERLLGLCSCFDRPSMSVLDVTKDQRGAHPALRRERPVDAAGFRVERIDRAVLAADEEPSACNGGLRPGGR